MVGCVPGYACLNGSMDGTHGPERMVSISPEGEEEEGEGTYRRPALVLILFGPLVVRLVAVNLAVVRNGRIATRRVLAPLNVRAIVRTAVRAMIVCTVHWVHGITRIQSTDPCAFLGLLANIPLAGPIIGTLNRVADSCLVVGAPTVRPSVKINWLARRIHRVDCRGKRRELINWRRSV